MSKKVQATIPDKQEFDYAARDQRRWAKMGELFEKLDYDHEDILRNFSAFVRRREVPRFLAHYELFKHTIDLPGCILELGVFKGGSLMTWANLMETFCPGDRYRMVYGFDHFQGLTDYAEEDGKLTNDRNHDKLVGGWQAPAEISRLMVELFNEDTIVPNIKRVQLVEGDIFDTLPVFLKENPGLKIALLHLDVDLYKVTKFALEQLYPLVLEGGVVCFDEYGLVPWQGETTAADEYFESIGERPVYRKFPFVPTPSGYFIKGKAE